MKKIYISPSDQTENPYAVGGTNEGVQCHRIAEALAAAFERVGGVSVKYNKEMAISKGMKESNDWGADYHICIHTNAFNGTVMGTRMFYGKAGGLGYKACLSIMQTLSPITPGTSDNITQNTALNEVRNITGATVYIEVGFHDNKTEARWIIDHTTEIAEAICEGMCNHLGIEYTAPNANAGGGNAPVVEKPIEPTGIPYYVVVAGVYRNRSGAETTAKDIKDAGFPAFIRTEIR